MSVRRVGILERYDGRSFPHTAAERRAAGLPPRHVGDMPTRICPGCKRRMPDHPECRRFPKCLTCTLPPKEKENPEAYRRRVYWYFTEGPGAPPAKRSGKPYKPREERA